MELPTIDHTPAVLAATHFPSVNYNGLLGADNSEREHRLYAY